MDNEHYEEENTENNIKEEKTDSNESTATELYEKDYSVNKISGMYQDWFLDYASYVILERAIPDIFDGLKPVQRRIIHSTKELDDGRYNKVANIVGNTMKYHPHGDASIGDAMVQLGQKELLIDTQGNWGNILTGDRAAASRYIEARLSKFALEVLFNPKITEWQASYDGRNKEPVHLPVKFPLLLVQGVEGIAVGLSTKIMPHNFNELIDASIKYLRGKEFEILPDFMTGGIADFSNYNDGLRGGRIRVRCRIAIEDKKTLKITEIPFGTTTSSLIDSILRANDRGKIKVKKIEDNTAENVEIIIHLPANISPDKTMDALFAFTDCEVSISPLSCVIKDEKPVFVGVSYILKTSTDNTLDLLKKELEVQLHELEEQWHMSSLERIFIENRIYLDIEKEETWEGVMSAIHEGLKPHTKNLIREVEDEDVIKLTEIRIKRISKFDISKAQLYIESIEEKITKIKHSLDNLVDFAIDYFKSLKKKYGKNKKRKTEISLFGDIVASKVVIRNEKLYVNRKDGFVGFSLKKDELISECSDLDDIIVFRKNGTMVVSKISAKAFFGKDILHVAVFKKADKRTVYNMIYYDGASGVSYMKRFNVTGVTRDREYNLITSAKTSKVTYFSANPNGEAEIVSLYPRTQRKMKKNIKFEIDFADLVVKGRGVRGNQASKMPIRKIELKEKGVSTLAARKIWYDDTIKRLNVEGRGRLIGEFLGDDRLLIITSRGTIKLVEVDLAIHFDSEMITLEKWKENLPVTAVYYEGDKKRYFIKRFIFDRLDKEELFISESRGSSLLQVILDYRPMIEVKFASVKGRSKINDKKINVEEFVGVKGIKALGNQLATSKIKQIEVKEPLPYNPLKEEGIDAEVQTKLEE